MKTGSLLSVILFLLVAVAHLLRLIRGSEVLVDGSALPMWVSVVGVVVPLALAGLLWKESR